LGSVTVVMMCALIVLLALGIYTLVIKFNQETGDHYPAGACPGEPQAGSGAQVGTGCTSSCDPQLPGRLCREETATCQGRCVTPEEENDRWL
jgi:hypothetical protein